MDADAWDERYRSTDLLWSAGPNRWVEEVTADLVPGRALDVASGEGRNAIWLASRGWTVTAVDFSDVAVDRGREMAQRHGQDVTSRISWVGDDVRTYQPEPGGFDLVVIAYLHLPADERRAVGHHAQSALAPGGRLLVVGHDVANITEGVGGPQDATILFRAGDIVGDLAGRGLVVERAEPVRRPVEDQGEAIDALVLLRRSAAPATSPST